VKTHGRKLSAVERAEAAIARLEARLAAEERDGCIDAEFELDWL
jgi:hypothetical protein